MWFDGVRVATDPWDPGPGPDPGQLHLPLTARGFDLGFTAEGPMDLSEQASVLSTMLGELASVDTIALIWFQLFDRLYLEAPQWASDAFDHIGMMDLSRTPKESLALWQATYSLPRVRQARRPHGRFGRP